MVSSLIGVRWVMAPVGWWMPSNLLCDALFHHCARLLLCFAFSTTDIRPQCGSVVQPEALFIISPSHNLFWWKPQSLSEICHQTSSSEELKNLCLCTLDCQKKNQWSLLSPLPLLPLIWSCFLGPDFFLRRWRFLVRRAGSSILHKIVMMKHIWALCSELVPASLCSCSVVLDLHIYYSSSAECCCFSPCPACSLSDWK